MPPSIHLVRHGRSAHVIGGWVHRKRLDEWFAAYDAAALHPTETPPQSVRDLASNASVIVSSDLPRAYASARLLRDDVTTSPLLRESVLPIPRFNITLPIVVWATATGINWLRAMRRGDWPDAEERKRGEAAARFLIERATDGVVVAITHSAFRRVIAEELLRAGWDETVSVGGNRYWSIRTFDRAG